MIDKAAQQRGVELLAAEPSMPSLERAVKEGAITMAGLEAKGFFTPDETREFAGKGRMEIVKVGGVAVGKGTFEPGWRWSTNVKPIAGTETCQALHLGYIVSGRMQVAMDDGTEGEAGPGMVVHIAPGHDAWVIGEEPCVFLDFGTSVNQYAKQ
jgi:hypothetical protein